MNNPSTNFCLESHPGYSSDVFLHSLKTPVVSEVIELAQEPITYLERADDIEQCPHSSQRKMNTLCLD